MLSARILNKILHVIAELESGNNPKKRGARGEVTAYQIMPRNLPVLYYLSNPKTRDKDAAMHCLVCNISSLERVNSEYGKNLGLILATWNYGITKVKRCRYNVSLMPACVRNYVERGSNIYAKLLLCSSNP
jgi:Transglycosylase SLT domain